jgi:transcription initiation factor TFIIF subunit beta
MERWSTIDIEDVHLASLRIYTNAAGPSGKRPRIVLFLPPNTNADPTANVIPDPSRPIFIPDSSYTAHRPVDEPDVYELEMVNDSVDNQIVVAERPKDPLLSIPGAPPSGPVNPRARTTILTGRIKHECNLRPVFSASYRKQMKERSRKYNTPKRQIRRIEEADVPGGRGGVNRLSSGVGVGAGNAFQNLIVRATIFFSFRGFGLASLRNNNFSFGSSPFHNCVLITDFTTHKLQPSKPKHAKGSFERMARIPRNQLLDLIFNLFRDTPRWGIKPLREKTQQPEAYLKEVLSEVAELHRSGEYNGLWELKDNFKGDGVSGCSLISFFLLLMVVLFVCRSREKGSHRQEMVTLEMLRLNRLRGRKKRKMMTIWRRFHEMTTLASVLELDT